MRHVLVIALFAAALSGCVEPEPAPTIAQVRDPYPGDPRSPGIAGHVLQESIEPVHRAQVTIRTFDKDGMTLAFLTGDTDSSGRFWFCGHHRPIDYLLTISHDGYAPHESRHSKAADPVHHRAVLFEE